MMRQILQKIVTFCEVRKLYLGRKSSKTALVNKIIDVAYMLVGHDYSYQNAMSTPAKQVLICIV